MYVVGLGLEVYNPKYKLYNAKMIKKNLRVLESFILKLTRLLMPEKKGKQLGEYTIFQDIKPSTFFCIVKSGIG